MTSRRVAVFGSKSFPRSDLIDHLLADFGTEVLGISRSPEKGRLFLPRLERESHNFRFVQAVINHDVQRVLGELDAVAPVAMVNFAAQSEVGPSCFMLHDRKQITPQSSVCGMDISTYAIENAMEDVKPYGVGDARALPIADNSFDLAMSINYYASAVTIVDAVRMLYGLSPTTAVEAGFPIPDHTDVPDALFRGPF